MKERQDNLAAGGPARSRGAALSGLRPPFLNADLDHFGSEVQRFFPVPKGSLVESFNGLAPRYSGFELQPLDANAHGTGATSR